MPLRDHFRPPVPGRKAWYEIHGAWPTTITFALNRTMPAGYSAGPHISSGRIEIDVAAFRYDDESADASPGDDDRGGTATAVWAPARPTCTMPTDFSGADEYEVRVYDEANERELVAAVEIVSLANKDRPEHRRAFVAKCAALLQRDVSVTIIDVVTSRSANLYAEMLDFLDLTDPDLGDRPAGIYAVSCRGRAARQQRYLDNWYYPLTVGGPLPTMPLWLRPDLAVRLDLESTYEETCRGLLIP